MIPGIVAKKRRALSVGDPYWNSVLLLINGDSGLTDETGGTNTTGSFSQITDGDFPNGGLDTASDSSWLVSTGSPSSYFDMAGDFTIEWMYRAATKIDQFPFVMAGVSTDPSGTWPGAFTVVDRHNSYPNRFTVFLGNSVVMESSTAPVVGEVYHLALVRSGTLITFYVNGTAEDTYTYAGTLTTELGVYQFGAYGSAPSTTQSEGTYAKIRITKDVARYTSNYTPDTALFPTSLP